MPLASSSVRPDFDLEVASAYNSEIVKNKMRTIEALGLDATLETCCSRSTRSSTCSR